MFEAWETNVQQTWLTPKLREGGNEGGKRARDKKEQDASDKVELRYLGSTYQFYGNIWRIKQRGNLSWGAEKAGRRKPGKQSGGI
jgi:hypothetical protein